MHDDRINKLNKIKNSSAICHVKISQEYLATAKCSCNKKT